MNFRVFFFLILTILIIGGCSGGGSNPVLPDGGTDPGSNLTGTNDPARDGTGSGNHLPLFVFRIEYDPLTNTIEAIPDRDLWAHFNVTSLLFPPNCNDCFDLYVVDSNAAQGWIELYVSVRNPAPIGAHDARIILDNQVDGYGVVNPDGWTELFDTGGFPRNQFLALAKTVPGRLFGGGETHARQFYFYYPVGGYNPADYVVTVEVSFPDNCEEPYEITNIELENTAIPLGGTPIELTCRVHSWYDDVDEVTAYIEAHGDTTTLYTLPLIYDGTDLWYGDISLPGGSMPVGDYELWIEATGAVDPAISMWQKENIQVVNIYTAWDGIANTFGGKYDDAANDVAVDGSGNVYVTGFFCNTVDFDGELGPEPQRSSHGAVDNDCYLIKYTSAGVIDWIKTWGGVGSDYANGTIVDPDGEFVYVVGEFSNAVYFNPDFLDPDSIRYSNGSHDIFVLKLDADGNYVDVTILGGDGSDSGKEIACDPDGDIFIVGSIEGMAYFEDLSTALSSKGNKDAFVAKFRMEADETMSVEWAKSWGAGFPDAALGVATNSNGDVFVTGYYTDIVNFNPGMTPVVHESNGGTDIYVSKFNMGGSHRWTEVWGDEDNDCGFAVAVQDDEYVYVTGYFMNQIEIETSGIIESEGYADIFLVKWRDIGTFTNFEWLKTWGYPLWAQGVDVTPDGSDYVYLTGRYNAVVDPGPDEQRIAFLRKVEAEDGDNVWVSDWGGPFADCWAEGASVAVDPAGYPYVGGYYLGTIDFDSGPTDEFHTSNGQMDAFVCKFDVTGPLPVQPEFDEITPVIGYRNQIVTATITGFVLQNVDQVWLEKDDNPYVQIFADPGSIFATPTYLTCDFDLLNAPVGTYHVKGLAGAVIVIPIMDGFEIRNLAAQNADWTYLVYIREDAAIQDASWDNINEMEDAGSLEGDLNIVVLWDRVAAQDELLYIVKHESNWNTWSQIMSPRVNSAGAVLPLAFKTQQEIMEDFVVWAMGEFPADHYVFNISSSGGFPYVLTNVGIWTVRDAMQTVLAHPVCNVAKLDVIGLEVVGTSYIETAYCLKDVTSSLVANETNSVGIDFWDFGGFRYSEPLEYLRDNATVATYEGFCTAAVTEFLNWSVFPPGKNLAACHTGNSIFNDAMARLNDFSIELIDAYNYPAYRMEIEGAADYSGTWGYSCSDPDDKDLGLFAQGIPGLGLPATLITAAEDLVMAIDQAMIAHGHTPDPFGFNPPCPFQETGWQIWFPQNFCDEPGMFYNQIGFNLTEWFKFIRKYDRPTLSGCSSAQNVALVETLLDEVVAENSANWYHFNTPTGVDNGDITITMSSGNADLFVYATNDPGNCPGDLIVFSVNESSSDHVHLHAYPETDYFIMVLNDECDVTVTYDLEVDVAAN